MQDSFSNIRTTLSPVNLAINRWRTSTRQHPTNLFLPPLLCFPMRDLQAPKANICTLNLLLFSICLENAVYGFITQYALRLLSKNGDNHGILMVTVIITYSANTSKAPSFHKLLFTTALHAMSISKSVTYWWKTLIEALHSQLIK